MSCISISDVVPSVLIPLSLVSVVMLCVSGIFCKYFSTNIRLSKSNCPPPSEPRSSWLSVCSVSTFLALQYRLESEFLRRLFLGCSRISYSNTKKKTMYLLFICNFSYFQRQFLMTCLWQVIVKEESFPLVYSGFSCR